MYKHIILFRFSSGLSHYQCLKLLEGLGRLQQDIPEIQNYRYGANDRDNLHHHGFDYAFVMEFADKDSRQRYQQNAHHQDYINHHLNHLIDDAIVFDMICE